MINAALFLLATSTMETNVNPPAPFGTVPSARHLKWHELETYGFVHFTINTFTDREWGNGDEDPKLFNPTAFDADQIVRAFKAGGLKGLILTAKHHDGFCLWPTKTTDHDISQSPWKGGKGDMVREFADACKRGGIKFGVYLSPWDRNNARYGKPEYPDLYRAQLRELMTQYGPLFEIWHDGANGGDGYYGGAREKRSIDPQTYYEWPKTWAMIRELQPNAVVFSDVGPDIRWVGNESGYAAETSWATYTPAGPEPGKLPAPGYTDSAKGEVGTWGGKYWIPAECDVSIRPGWFWHEAENGRVKTPQQLTDLYFRSVGHGGSFLLNIPPDRRGLVHENDQKSLTAFGAHVRATFAQNFAKGAKVSATNVRGSAGKFGAGQVLDGSWQTYWATDDSVKTASLTLDLGEAKSFNVVRIREALPFGHRVIGWSVEADGKEIAKGQSIGACRLVRLGQNVTAKSVTVRFDGAASLAITEVGLFAEPSF
ncbi:MAG: alpha-L-fucosidase [Fimbriimonas sp.]